MSFENPFKKKTPPPVEQTPAQKNAQFRDRLEGETMAAIREGDALPTPAFAIEQGPEMTTLLMREIQDLDPEQLDALKQNLEQVRELALSDTETAYQYRIAEIKAALPSKILSVGVGGIVGFVFGMAAGPVGGFVGAGVMAEGARRATNKNFSKGDEMIAATKERANKVLELINEVKSKQETQVQEAA